MSDMEIVPEIFTADYLGSPGHRSFYVQSRSSSGTNSFPIEKQQVAVLAERLRDMLLAIDEQDTVRATPPARDPALVLQEPIDPQWRIGAIGLGYEEESDRFIVLFQPTDEEAEDAVSEEGPSMRFTLRRDQVRSFVLHTAAIVEEGRPTCQLCGLPIDPEGHRCPASNGHRLTTI
ncbi:MAG: DUF3090 family protein [Actinomycetota bacterium]